MSDATRSIRRTAVLANLPEIVGFIEKSCREAGAADARCFDVKVAVDEVCSNIIQHGYRGTPPGPIDVTLHAEGDRVVITVSDEAVQFDPRTIVAPDLGSDWEQREAGGLGWHLVRRLMDDVRYEPRAGGGNIVTLIKNIKEK